MSLNVTMLGTTGSGKTSFMAGLTTALNELQIREDNFYIAHSPLNTDAVEQQRMQDKLVEIGNIQQLTWQGRNYEYPRGTDTTTIWPFDLIYRTKSMLSPSVVSPFVWMDYKGGILDEAVAGHRNPDVDQVVAGIVGGHALIIFVDSFLATYYEDMDDARRFTGAQAIMSILDAYGQAHRQRNLIYLIVMGKCDGLDQKWRGSNGAYSLLLQRGLEIYEPLVYRTRSNPRWSGSIMAVSAVGEGASKRTITREGDFRSLPGVLNKIERKPQPYNCDNALYYCIGKILEAITHRSQANIENMEVELERALESDTILNTIIALIAGRETPSKMAKKYQALLAKEEHVLTHYSAHMNELIRSANQATVVIR